MYKALLEEFRNDRRIDGKIGIKNNVGEEALEVAEAILNGDESKVIGEVCDIVVFCENYISCFDSADSYDDVHCHSKVKLKEVVIYGLLFETDTPDIEKAIHYEAFNLVSICKSAIESSGYDFELCMIEVCNKILSRKGAFNEEAGKWCKDPSQDKSELYAPQYHLCKKEA